MSKSSLSRFNLPLPFNGYIEMNGNAICLIRKKDLGPEIITDLKMIAGKNQIIFGHYERKMIYLEIYPSGKGIMRRRGKKDIARIRRAVS